MGKLGIIEVIIIIIVLMLILFGIFRILNKLIKTSQPALNTAGDFLNANINKVKKNVEKGISKNYLSSGTWQLYTNDNNSILYIFRMNNELLITTNGNVQKANYEYVIDNNSILITINGNTELWNILNAKNDFLFLNKVSTNKILFFFNQTKSKDSVIKAIEAFQRNT